VRDVLSDAWCVGGGHLVARCWSSARGTGRSGPRSVVEAKQSETTTASQRAGIVPMGSA